MKKYYHGAAQRGPYFEGWYLKFQTQDGRALALIPALHIDATGRRSASLQVVESGRSWWIEYPHTDFRASKDRFHVQVGSNSFDAQGAVLSIEQPGCRLQGAVRFGPFMALGSDIMGPFRFFAGMECSHGVVSMGHALEGRLNLNGEIIDFANGTGYIETDRGCSFPSAYLWTQCLWREKGPVSLMLSVAAIPLAGIRFTGCICAVFCEGREHRLATYRGARAEQWSPCGAVIRQGKYRLEVQVSEDHGQPLRAPVAGVMQRTIRESLCTEARYRFWTGGELLFDHTDPHASFEYSAD